VLEAIVDRVPPPADESDRPLQALIFDSVFDQFRGVIVYVRVVRGRIATGDRIRFFSNDTRYEVLEVGTLRLGFDPRRELVAGDVGYVIANVKVVADAKVGDTITLDERPAAAALPGYRPVKPMVFSGLYPMDQESYEELKESLAKLQLNDAALTFEPETSLALGFGFRCGFLGLLHMEIVQERLEREFGLDLIASAPSVEYQVHPLHGGPPIAVDNPAALPPAGDIEAIDEPWVKLSIVTPASYIGALMELSTNRRGSFLTMEYLDPVRVLLTFEMPLAELIVDYYDQLKSRTAGYASMDYEEIGYRPADLVKIDVLVNGEPVDALSLITHRDKAPAVGRQLTSKLKELIPRQMFEVPVQASIGSRVIARETIRAMRKNVLAKCYGGDITRKRKLLEKQKEGKQRMKRVGAVEIPQEAFLAMLRMDEG
jgi:GTP-binding protein LepA